MAQRARTIHLALCLSAGLGTASLGCSERTPWRGPAEAVAAAEALAARDAKLAKRLDNGRLTPWKDEKNGLATLQFPTGFAQRLRARVPESATGSLELILGASEVKLKPVGARSQSRVRKSGSWAVYEEQYDGVDGLVVGGEDFVEVLWLVKSAKARHRFEWEVTSPEWASTVRQEADSSLSFVNSLGDVGLKVQTAWGIDSAGRRVSCDLEWREGRVVVSMKPTETTTYPVLVDPVLELPGWTQMTMPARSGHAMATLGTKVVLFAGAAASGAPNDTWEGDGTNWTQRRPADNPPRRTAHAMVTLGAKIVLFGGGGVSGFLNDTWEWDGTNWTRLTPTTNPPARSGHTMATMGGKVLLFGGLGANGPLRDTWEWDGMTWTDRTPTTSPSARHGHGMAALGTKVVVFGGLGTGASF